MVAAKVDTQDFSYIPMQELVDKVGSVYKLVILAARRAIELNQGAGKLVDISPKAKLSTVALEEIREGKIYYKENSKAKNATEEKQ